MLQCRHILVALVAGLAATLLALVFHNAAAGDMEFPLCGALALLRGVDPYGGQCALYYLGYYLPLNPLTTVLVALPFVPLQALAAPVMVGSIAGLLAWAILRSGQAWRLLVFASPAYVQALYCMQWSPLVMAVYLLPALLPLTLVKPQIGLPVLLTRLTKRRLLACLAFLLLTLVIDPTWPRRWWEHAATYDGFIPLLVLPVGPLLALALWRWRSPEGRLLLLYAIMPQRAFYDLTPLWLVPATKRQTVILTGFAWVGFVLHVALGGALGSPVPPLAVAFFYLPALLVVLWPSIQAQVRTVVPLVRLQRKA